MGAIKRLLKPTLIIRRNFVRKGLMGGDRKWLALGAMVIAGGKVKSLFGFGVPAPVYIEEAKPGERFIVAHEETTSRRKRRRARKAAKKAA